MTTIKQALALLTFKKVGLDRNGKAIYSRPDIRAALIVLIANGKTVVLNTTAYLPDGAMLDLRNPKGGVVVGNCFHTKPAPSPLPEFVHPTDFNPR